MTDGELLRRQQSAERALLRAGVDVDTSRANTTFRPVAWWGRDDAAPLPTETAGDRRGQFWAPPRGYAVYAPA